MEWPQFHLLPLLAPILLRQQQRIPHVLVSGLLPAGIVRGGKKGVVQKWCQSDRRIGGGVGGGTGGVVRSNHS